MFQHFSRCFELGLCEAEDVIKQFSSWHNVSIGSAFVSFFNVFHFFTLSIRNTITLSGLDGQGDACTIVASDPKNSK